MDIYNNSVFYYNNYMQHYGIQGQKWGIRRFQNPDGSLTEEGRSRYGVSARGQAKMYTQGLRAQTNQLRRGSVELNKQQRRLDSADKAYEKAKINNDGSAKAKAKERAAEKKLNKQKSQYDFQLNAQKIGKQELDRILEMASSRGYNITSKDKKRITMNGQEIVAALTVGAATGLLTGVSVAPFRTTTAPEYKVKATRYSF